MKRIRVEAGLTQRAIAQKVGKTRQWVSKVERGKIAISVDAVDSLADALEVTSCELLLVPTREDFISLFDHTGCISELWNLR